MNQAALPPARHFSAEEFAARRARVLRAIAAAGLDGAIFFPAGNFVLAHRLR